MAEDKKDLELVKESTAPAYSLAVLTREDGPYAVGTAITTDPGAPWYKGDAPKFAEDKDLMAAWRANGKPFFVAQNRFDSWKRDGYFSEQKQQEKAAPPPTAPAPAASGARPDAEKEARDVS